MDQCERRASQAWDTDEEIEVLTAPITTVYDWAREGKITHSLVLDALLFFVNERSRYG